MRQSTTRISHTVVGVRSIPDKEGSEDFNLNFWLEVQIQLEVQLELELESKLEHTLLPYLMNFLSISTSD